MNGVDYAKNLSKEKQYTRKVLDRQQRAHEDEMKALKESRDHRLKSSSKSYENSVKDMRNQFEKRYADLNEDQRSELQKIQNRYNERITEERDSINKEKGNNLEQWQRKINHLRDEYNKDLKYRTQDYESKNEQNIQRYNTALKNVQDKNEKNFKEYQDNALGSTKKAGELLQKEKRQLIDEHKKDRGKLLKEHVESRNDFRTKVTNDIAKIRKQKEDDVYRIETQADRKFQNLVESSSARLSNLKADYDRETEKANDAKRLENKKSNRAFTERFAEQEKRYNQRLSDINFRREKGGLGSSNPEIDYQKALRQNDKNEFEIKKNMVIADRNKLEESYSKKIQDMQESFSDTYRNVKLHQFKSLENKFNEINKEAHKRNITNETEIAQLKTEHQVAKNTMNKDKDEAVNEAQADSARKIKKMKRDFSYSQKLSQEENRQILEEAREELLAEKREFAKKMSEQNSEKTAFIRKNYTDKIDKLVDDYEKRINNLVSQNKIQKNKFEAELLHVKERASEDIKVSENKIRKVAKQEMENQKNIADGKVDQLRNQIRNLKANFEQKIGKERLDSDRKLKNLTLKYESEVRKLKNTHSEAQELTKRFFEKEIAALKLATNNEKEVLKGQYENRISKLEQINQEKLAEIENYNKLHRT